MQASGVQIESRNSLYGFEFREFDERRVETGERQYNIKQLWQRSHEILALALQGYKQVEIAKILDIHPQTVCNTLNSEIGMKKLSEMRGQRDEGIVEVSKEVARLSEKALRVYEEIFNSPNADLKIKKETADTVLMDLGGHRAPTKIDSRSIHTTATLNQIEEFKKRGLIAAREAGLMVDFKESASGTRASHAMIDDSQPDGTAAKSTYSDDNANNVNLDCLIDDSDIIYDAIVD